MSQMIFIVPQLIRTPIVNFWKFLIIHLATVACRIFRNIYSPYPLLKVTCLSVFSSAIFVTTREQTGEAIPAALVLRSLSVCVAGVKQDESDTRAKQRVKITTLRMIA